MSSAAGDTLTPSPRHEPEECQRRRLGFTHSPAAGLAARHMCFVPQQGGHPRWLYPDPASAPASAEPGYRPSKNFCDRVIGNLFAGRSLLTVESNCSCSPMPGRRRTRSRAGDDYSSVCPRSENPHARPGPKLAAPGSGDLLAAGAGVAGCARSACGRAGGVHEPPAARCGSPRCSCEVLEHERVES